jgi:hypothetical protein
MDFVQRQITQKMQMAVFNKGMDSEKEKQLTRLFTTLKIYSPKFEHGMRFYYFEQSESMSSRNIDSDSEEETLVT